MKQYYEWDKPGYYSKFRDNEVISKFRKKMLSHMPDKEFGLFYGEECSKTEKNTHLNKKYVEIFIADQKEFDKVLNELDGDLRGVYFWKCQGIADYSGLEKFSNLECVSGYWNNSLKKLWNASKTPKLNELFLNQYNKLDCAAIEDFTELKHLFYVGKSTVESFDFLNKLKKLEQLELYVKVLSNDIRPILSLKNLKNYYVGDKYHKYIEKYLKDGTLPSPLKPSAISDMPTAEWRESESTSMTKKQLKQIEKILTDFSESISRAESIATAIENTALCVNELNKFSENIETIEREELFDYLMGKAKEEWYDEIAKVIDNVRDW